MAWPNGAAEVVFGTHKGVVDVFAGTPTEQQFPPAFPCCMIIMGSGTHDEDAPGLLEQTFRIVIGSSATGSPLGSHALIGGPSRDLGKSPNRGTAELTERVVAAIGDLDGADGLKLQLSATATSSPFTVGKLRHIAFAELTVTALCTSDLNYAAPQEIALSGSAWTWAGGTLDGPGHCSGRFDFKQYRLVEKTGFTASTSPSDGTVLQTVTAGSATQAPTAGRTYTVFADYSDRKQTGVIEGSSDPRVGSYLVVE